MESSLNEIYKPQTRHCNIAGQIRLLSPRDRSKCGDAVDPNQSTPTRITAARGRLKGTSAVTRCDSDLLIMSGFVPCDAIEGDPDCCLSCLHLQSCRRQACMRQGRWQNPNLWSCQERWVRFSDTRNVPRRVDRKMPNKIR